MNYKYAFLILMAFVPCIEAYNNRIFIREPGFKVRFFGNEGICYKDCYPDQVWAGPETDVNEMVYPTRPKAEFSYRTRFNRLRYQEFDEAGNILAHCEVDLTDETAVGGKRPNVIQGPADIHLKKGCRVHIWNAGQGVAAKPAGVKENPIYTIVTNHGTKKPQGWQYGAE